MNNPAVPDERPPYWGKCKEMSFGELRKFIDDSLTALAKPGSGNDWPRSKEEFLELVDMLLKKVEELAGEVPPPPPETEYVSPPSVPYPTSPRSPWYEPPEQLAAAYDRHQELTERLRYALDEGSSRRYIEQLESDLRVIEREIAERERAEELAYKKRIAEYERADTEYWRSTRLRREYERTQQERQQFLAQKERIVQRIRRDIERAFRPGAAEPTGHIQWKPLPKGKDTPRKIRQHYERLHHQRRIGGFDQERLDKATALPYEHWWVPTEGFGGFDAYSIFSFAHTGKVLLECPIYGNAIYVVEAGEERWLRMSKQELIESGAAKKIPHQGDWYRRVRQELEIG